MRFVAARNFTKGRKIKPNLIVIHTAETPERSGTAHAVAAWFGGANAPKASAHFCVDDKEIVQCVRVSDTAWACNQPNGWSVSIELTGRASQTREQWADTFSAAVLSNAARLCASLCNKLEIPAVKLDREEVVRRLPGLCGHDDITYGYRIRGGHVDPGVNFPWDRFVEMVAEASRDGLRQEVEII